jgi:hypothetical protein
MARENVIYSLINVTKMRIAKEEKALTRLALELRESRNEFGLCMQKETVWKERKAGWEREISGAGSLRGLPERARAGIRQKIDIIDHRLARVMQRRRLLETDLKTLQEQCRLQRKIILKQNDLQKIFQKRIEREIRQQLQIAEEDGGMS